MPKLICDVRNCSHNKEDHCTLTYIQVDGGESTNVEDTCCSNFISSSYEANNVAHNVQKEVDVKCTAAACIHNFETECKAGQVAMSGASTASCSHDTQCGSFCCK